MSNLQQNSEGMQNSKKSKTAGPAPTKWIGLPIEMREMVIDRMDSETRESFAVTSKKSRSQTLEWKYYVSGMQFQEDAVDGKEIRIFVKGKCGSLRNATEYYLKFEKLSANMVTKRVNMDGAPVFMKSEITDLSAKEYAITQFPKFVEKYAASIEILHINSHQVRFTWSNDFEFKKLKTLNVTQDADAKQLIMRATCPLEHLKVGNIVDINFWQTEDVLKKVYSVRKSLIMQQLALNSEQFYNLSANIIQIGRGDLDEAFILLFVQKYEFNALDMPVTMLQISWEKDEDMDMRAVYKELGFLRGRDPKVVPRQRYPVYRALKRRADLYFLPGRFQKKFIFQVALDYDTANDDVSDGEFFDESDVWGSHVLKDADDAS